MSTRRGPGGEPGPTSKITEQVSAGKDDGTTHDPAKCATCCGYVPWTEQRRARALTYAATARRRICDLPAAS